MLICVKHGRRFILSEKCGETATGGAGRMEQNVMQCLLSAKRKEKKMVPVQTLTSFGLKTV